MKKTLFALMASVAIVSQAAAADTLLNTTTFSIGSGANVDAVTCTNTSDELQLTLTGLTKSGSNTSNTFGDIFYKNNDTNVNSTLTPNQNVGNSGNTWTLTFSLTNTGSETAWVNSLDLTMMGLNGAGDAQNTNTGAAMPEGANWVAGTDSGNKPVDMTLAWSEGSQSLTYNVATGNNNRGSWTDTPHTGTFSGLGWQIGAGESLEFTITAANNSAYTKGTFAGIKSIAVSVPEPATATLSLLALAGLAARRRRK